MSSALGQKASDLLRHSPSGGFAWFLRTTRALSEEARSCGATEHWASWDRYLACWWQPPLVAAPAAAAAPGPTAMFVPCPPGTPGGARCGTVTVPLDRADPGGATIPIAFQLYPATDTAKPAVSTIVSSNGGPGVSNIASAGFWLSRLQPLMDRHNFLAVDHRGIGASQAIDCPGLQHVQGDQVAAARECGAKLSTAAYRYGSGDVADDIDAVRQALHLDKIDYYASPTVRPSRQPTTPADISAPLRQTAASPTWRGLRPSTPSTDYLG